MGLFDITEEKLQGLFHRVWVELGRGFVDPRKYPYLDKALYMYAREHVCGEISMNSEYRTIIDSFTTQANDLLGDQMVKVILYGSYARGDYDEHSDIDMMFLTSLSEDEIRKEKNKLYDLAFEYEMDYGVEISVIIKNIEDFQYWLGALPFYDNINREGIVLHG